MALKTLNIQTSQEILFIWICKDNLLLALTLIKGF